MRCVTCQAEGITRRLYCECCGRELSMCQLEPDEDRTPEKSSPPVARCKGCGAPSVDGHDCGSCQQAFNSWLGNAEPAPETEATTPAETVAAEESVWAELMTSAPSNEASDPADPSSPAPSAEVALPAPLVPEVTAASANGPEAVKTEPANDETVVVQPAELEMTKVDLAAPDEVKAEATEQEAPKTEPAVAAIKTEMAEAPAATMPVTETPRPENASNAGVFNERPFAPSSSQPRSRLISVVAPVVILAAIGVGAYGFRIQGQPMTAREEQPPIVRAEPQTVIAPEEQVTVSARDITAPEPQPQTTDVPAATSGNDRKATPAVPQVKPSVVRPVKTPAPPKSVTRASVKPAWPRAAEQVAPLQASNLATLHAPAVAPAPPEVVAIPSPAPAPARPAPAQGPFFETTDVNESPEVVTRVKPQLPDDLRAGSLNDIVIVRVLVSQSGHPSRVALLRKSKSGRRLDDAVVAAVNRWTFAPARKRGEAVSCWLNVGVPIGRADQ